MQVIPDDLTSAPPGVGAADLHGRLVNPDGSVFRESFAIVVERLPPSDAGAPRRDVWAAFYEHFGVTHIADGEFRISPLAADPLTFQIRPAGRPAIRVGTFRRGTLRSIELGDIQVRKGATASIALAHESDLVPSTEVFDVEARLTRPDPGTDVPAAPLQGRISKAQPLVLRNLPLGAWLLSLKRGGLLLGRETVTILEDNAKVSWRLSDETCMGTVLDDADNPLEAVEVSVQYPARGSTRTDENGHFVVRFPHAGGTVPVFARIARQSLPQFKDLDPRSAEAQAIDFRLPRNQLRVVVQDSKQQPIKEASVHVHTFAAGLTRDSHLTFPVTSDGEALVKGLPDSRVELRTSAPGFTEDGPRDVSFTEGSATVKVVLTRSDKVIGRVVDLAGAPLGGARVAGPLRGENFLPVITTAGPDGHFELDAPAGQPSLIAAWAPGFRLGLTWAQASPNDLVITIGPRGADAEFEIVSPTGEGLDRASWSLLFDSVAVDSKMLYESFSASGCPLYSVTSSRLRFGGCVMPATYSLALALPVADRKVTLYRSEPFNTGDGGRRLVAHPTQDAR
jgi:hypothetical protein